MAPCSSPAANGNSDSVVVNLLCFSYSDDDLLALRNYLYFVLLLLLFKVYFY